MPKPLSIAGRHFNSQLAATRHARDILHRDKAGTDITADDIAFVEAILAARSDKLVDLHGLNVIRYFRDWQDKAIAPQKWTLCFWAELEDGTLVDFSYQKAIVMLGDIFAASNARQ